ncbi:CHAT domain-containing protein [Pyxidicoccus xibeiensis]|uniref:CHAT domain-containing protein n=1 Tax=Pyxidicoccus xibeiensis TaxID=2906759 RepID=UPI0020A6E9DD|nr:CHAT domain-containing protein [Pyxidicoccus xibeiensis]MCP3139269.1 CHAT domain-containing protein [Pyxidicoccus xibeiensis]
MEAAGDVHGLAAAYLVRGNAQMAVPYLQKAGDSPDVASDKAVMALDRKDYATALTLLERALQAQPKHAQALWNRGLVLRELDLWLLAAQSFEAVAELGEHGWAAEARARAKALRGRMDGLKEWRAAVAAGEALVAGTGTMSAEQLQARPGVFRMFLYEAMRVAPSVERLKALWPVAETLDARFGGSTLRDTLRWTEARDFRRRGPLAARYLELYRTHKVEGGLEAYLEEVRRAGERDLFLGALVREEKVSKHLGAFTEVASQVRDPWFLLLAEYEKGLQAISRGALLEAEQIYLGAVARCREQQLDYRCAPIHAVLGDLYRQLHRLPESNSQVLAARAAYRNDGRWGETRFLLLLGQNARYQGESALARALLEEALVRAPEDCGVRHFVRANDALALLGELSVAAARQRMSEALSCEGPLSLAGAKTMADLSRLSPNPEQDQRLLVGLESRRRTGSLSPGEMALATFIEGHFYMERDRARGEALLQRAIVEAKRLPSYNVDARKALSYSYRSLLVAAGRAGEYERALALFGEELGGTLPKRCLMAVSADDGRLLILAIGPDGRTKGHFEANHSKPLGTDARGVVPDELVEALRACPQVDVVARPPLHGQAELLPPDVAWAYYVLRPPPTRVPTVARSRLVVADVEAPSALGLPPLGVWEQSPGEGTRVLSGSKATPSRVLEAMADATEIEVHAHGLVNPNVSEASLLVLSPESSGRYALTAGEVQARALRGQPLVILAACRAAKGAPWMHERFSLPVAFIDAGARTVLAATVDVPDAEAGPFFNEVRGRIQRGQHAASALRDVRMEWLARDPQSWVRAVLVFD